MENLHSEYSLRSTSGGSVEQIRNTVKRFVVDYWYVVLGLVIVLLIVVFALSISLHTKKSEGINTTSTLRYIVNGQENLSNPPASTASNCGNSTLTSGAAWEWALSGAEEGAETAVGSKKSVPFKSDSELTKILVGGK